MPYNRYSGKDKGRRSEAQGSQGDSHAGLSSRLSRIEARLSGLEKGLRALVEAGFAAAARSAKEPSPPRKKQYTSTMAASNAAAAGKKLFQHLQLDRATSAWSKAFPPNLERREA